jgi:hypothetical protein
MLYNVRYQQLWYRRAHYAMVSMLSLMECIVLLVGSSDIDTGVQSNSLHLELTKSVLLLNSDVHPSVLISAVSNEISPFSMLVSGSVFSIDPSSWASVGTPDSTVNAMDAFRDRDGPYVTDAVAARIVENKEISALARKRGTAPYELYAYPPSRAPSPDPRPQWMLSTMAYMRV